MKIETIYDINLLQHLLNDAFGEIPENLIIVSDKAVEESYEHMGIGKHHIKNAKNIKILGVRVMKSDEKLN